MTLFDGTADQQENVIHQIHKIPQAVSIIENMGVYAAIRGFVTPPVVFRK